MRLYRHPLSSCSRRAVLTVLELGIADRVELVTVDLAKGAQKDPAYLKLNPNGRVPTLDDDGFVLWESHAIMQYLADGTPGQTLYPTERRARADVTRWMFWNAHHFSSGIAVLNRERMVKKLLGHGDPDPVEVARGDALVRQFGGVLDAHLADHEWISGGRLSLADLSIAAELATMERAQLPVGEFANLTSWLARITGRDSWSKAGA
ncbi:MAG: glutathione S-transferase family protein [Kofleriaceae bacterium]